MTEGIIIAILGFAGTLAGSYFSQRKNTVLISYRIEQLEDKVQKHNNLIERTYELEKQQSLQEEQLKEVNKKIEDIERER